MYKYIFIYEMYFKYIYSYNSYVNKSNILDLLMHNLLKMKKNAYIIIHTKQMNMHNKIFDIFYYIYII